MSAPDQLPAKYDPAAVEAKWRALWDERGTYAFDPDSDAPTFSIDTPPPTVSGALHVGHAFSYTHTDLIARYQRMRGRNVFYPMGWDDNGLPTERRVRNLHNVRCQGPRSGRTPDGSRSVSREEFLELCAQVADEDERAFEDLWRRLALSVDWAHTYSTNDPVSRRITQRRFLELVRSGDAYTADAPTVWDVDFRTAVAQADVEEREADGFEHRLLFGIEGGALPIMTTRPELLGACVGVIVHPQDERYARLVGGTAVTPGYCVRVPVMAHPLAERDKGTGVVMVCTFGDATDVEWWQGLGLATRMLVERDGTLRDAPWGEAGWESTDPAAAQLLHDRLVGLPAKQAGRKLAELLAGRGMAGDPRPVRRAVRFYEKGDQPLEILLTRQWFVRLMDRKDELLERGRQVQWHPAFMRERYVQWVEGLRSDWCVSRQRYLGPQVPVWYPLNDAGEADYDAPILPDDGALPVDPMAEPPPGYAEEQRDRPGGFTADGDVLDTWATSSLTPELALARLPDGAARERLRPMDIRPQGHDIIRTWAFYTIARAHLHGDDIPWRNALISGWVRDPKRGKMSKSKGNTVTPQALIDRCGADAVRHWAARARLGADAAYDEAEFKVGKRLATKLFNAGKLIVGRLRESDSTETILPLDRAFLCTLADVAARATESLDAFDAAGALDAAETWFWHDLCDNYLELTKARAYAGDGSALATWEAAMSGALRLLAPFVPHVAEEVWSWHFGRDGTSVHRAPWPEAEELSGATGDRPVFDAAVEVLTQVRRYKTENQLSLRTPVASVTVSGPADMVEALEAARADVMSAGAVEELVTQAGETTELRATVRVP